MPSILNIKEADLAALVQGVLALEAADQGESALRLDRLARSAAASLDNHRAMYHDRTRRPADRMKTWRDMPTTLRFPPA